MIDVELPELGESVVEGTVARWLVKEGDRVEADQPIVEVTTDKVDAEIPSPVAGVVASIEAQEDEVVAVGAVLARIDPAGAAREAGAARQRGGSEAEAESARETRGEPARETRAEPSRETRAEPSRDETRAEPSRDETRAEPSRDETEAPRATPLARRVAEERGVDLRGVRGTGPGGRVRRADVERGEPKRAEAGEPAAKAARATAGAPARRRPTPDFGHYAIQEGDEVIPMSPLRRLVAEHMVFSKQHAPHVGTVAEIDMGGVVALRESGKRAFQEAHGVPLTFLPFVVSATVRALREHPDLNASVLEDAIVRKRDIHLGVAVETEKGLVVPVVRHADRLSLAGLAASIEDLSERARSKKLSADDLRGGTFTVSNPGRHGNLYGFAIINQPQVGILRMGEIVKRPVVRSADGADAIAIRPIMHLALSYDHRAVDGAPANAFLHRVKELLEGADFDL